MWSTTLSLEVIGQGKTHVHLAENLLLLFRPQSQNITIASSRSSGSEGGCEKTVRGNTPKQPVLNQIFKTSARLLPLESPHLAEGARDQRSSARRGLHAAERLPVGQHNVPI